MFRLLEGKRPSCNICVQFFVDSLIVFVILCYLSYYGGRIWESLRDQDNADVMFHLRNEHYEYCTENGIDGEISQSPSFVKYISQLISSIIFTIHHMYF